MAKWENVNQYVSYCVSLKWYNMTLYILYITRFLFKQKCNKNVDILFSAHDAFME